MLQRLTVSVRPSYNWESRGEVVLLEGWRALRSSGSLQLSFLPVARFVAPIPARRFLARVWVRGGGSLSPGA